MIFLYIILSIIAAIALYLTYFGIRFYIELQLLKPMDTAEIIENIFVVRDGYANMFFVKTSEQYIAIDAGKNPKNVEKEINKLNIPLEKVSAVFITHSDYDHIASVNLFPNAQIYISKEEEKMIDGSTFRLLISKNKFKADYKTLENNGIIKVENTTIEGILVPGHTYGLMCYLINGKYLFTGDAIGLKNGKVKILNHFFNKDSKMLRQSLIKLSERTEIQYIFTAHFKFSDDFNYAFEGF